MLSTLTHLVEHLERLERVAVEVVFGVSIQARNPRTRATYFVRVPADSGADARARW